MVLTLAIPIRAVYGLEDFITMRHLQNMAKVMLVTGLIVAYGYMTEAFIAWYSGNQYEGFMMLNRMTGPYAPVYWALILCNVVVPQVLWFKRVRTSVPALFVISLIVNVGMWLERFVIIVTSLHRDFLPSSWGMYRADVLGLVDVRRHDRAVPDAAVPLPALPADDLDLRDADDAAGSEGGRMMTARARPTVYGLMAEFDDPTGARRRRRTARTAKATGGWTRTRRSRSRSCTRRSASHHTRLPLIVLIGGLCRRRRRLRAAVLGVGDRLSAERRRQAAPQLAGVHPGDLRVHDSRRGAVGGARHAGAERAAAAVSPGVQRAALRAGEPQPVLPVHRGARSEVRPRGDARSSSRRSSPREVTTVAD